MWVGTTQSFERLIEEDKERLDSLSALLFQLGHQSPSAFRVPGLRPSTWTRIYTICSPALGASNNTTWSPVSPVGSTQIMELSLITM